MKSRDRNAARAGRPLQQSPRIERRQHRNPVGRRIGVAQAAADRAAIADGPISDVVRDARQQYRHARSASRPSAIAACVTQAPIVTASASSATPAISGRWLICTSSWAAPDAGSASGRATGRRPARAPRRRPAPACVTASARLAGRAWSNGAGFMCGARSNAARMRRGVIGSSVISTPERCERIVHRIGERRGRADRTALADALLAEHRQRRRRLHVLDADVRHFGRTGQQIVGECGSPAAGLPRRTASPRTARCRCLARRRRHLAIDDHRVDQRAAVLADA